MKTLFLVLAVAAMTPHAASAEEVIPRVEMKNMALNLGAILPLVISDTAFERPESRRKILTGLRNLAKSAHRIEYKLPVTNDDPLIGFVTVKLSRNFEVAAADLARGETGRARSLIRNATAYCISCHTRSAGGTATIAIEPKVAGVELSALDLAEFYTATRQFEKAIIHYEAVLNDQWFAQRYPHRWEFAAKKMLAIVVRVQSSPRLALELLAKIHQSNTVPASLARDAAIWRESVKEWLAAPTKGASVTDPLVRGKEQFEKGEALVAKTGSREAGLIPFLRASADLHEYLSLRREAAPYADALFLAGRTAEQLASLNLWTLRDSYFEACIKVSPHSAIARQCLERFKMAQLADTRSKTGAMVYADDVRERLDELSHLAN